MSSRLDKRVRKRALDRCEYCHVPQAVVLRPHQIDHVIAKKHGGETAMSNLALSCLMCNGCKGSNVAGVDTETGRIIRLFHPRRDLWKKHFRLRDNGLIDGLSSMGRVTIEVLRMNDAKSVSLRAALIEEGVLQTGRAR